MNASELSRIAYQASLANKPFAQELATAANHAYLIETAALKAALALRSRES